MRKRVAMAQASIVQPDLLRMDEPFGALDVHTRLRMESELLMLWADSHQTVIFVTHDLEEAISLSDEVFVLSAGPASRVVGRYPVDLERPEISSTSSSIGASMSCSPASGAISARKC